MGNHRRADLRAGGVALMALRIRVELVPHGREAGTEVLDEFIVANNGTGIPGGPDSGGVGNYDVYEKSLAELHSMDYPSEAKVGEIRELERSPKHRLTLAKLALELVEESRKEK